LDRRSRCGVALNADSGHCDKTRPRWWPTRRCGNARADIVALLLRRDTLRRLSAPWSVRRLWRTLFVKYVAAHSAASHTAPSVCGPVHIVAVGHSGERTLVYNLTVDDAHLFYANGILSSNTDMEDHAADSVRYAMLSRPFVRDLAPKPVVDSWSRAFQRASRADVDAWRIA